MWDDWHEHVARQEAGRREDERRFGIREAEPVAEPEPVIETNAPVPDAERFDEDEIRSILDKLIRAALRR